MKWINTLANLDKRIILALQHLRSGQWSYVSGSPLYSGLLQDAARDVGLPPSWGDPNQLPAYGRTVANEAWKRLGVTSRPGVGGIPCEVLHRNVGSAFGLTGSCTANAALRTLTGFTEALIIYLPVCVLPLPAGRDILIISISGSRTTCPTHSSAEPLATTSPVAHR